MSPMLGRTALNVSRIGLGLAALGRPAYINLGHAEDVAGQTDPSALEAQAHLVMDAAYHAGVRYFDAARSYGRAEEFLGSWLARRELGPEDLTVGSKWGYTYTAAWQVDVAEHEVKDLSVATLRRQIVETRERLGSSLRLYQVHSATLESGVLEDRDVREELDRLRNEHHVAIGFTATGARQRETIERALELGGFDAVQATWNLLDPSAGPALAAAHEAGLGVIIKEALANGRLTARGDADELIALARELDATPDALALSAVLAQPWVDIVLSGASTPWMLESNLRSVELDGTSVNDRLQGLAEDRERYWEIRSDLPWN